MKRLLLLSQIKTIKYGYLYNFYAISDARGIANTGWHVPTVSEYQTLRNFIDPGSSDSTNTAGGPLKETGLTYWDSPNTGATNSTKFNARGSGLRTAAGSFDSSKQRLMLRYTTDFVCEIRYDVDVFYTGNRSVGGGNTKAGISLRLIKDTTSLSDGQSGSYIGTDGKIYRTICIGTQEITADPIAETRYSNGDIIPTVTDGTTWAGLITGAKCAYDNNESNV